MQSQHWKLRISVHTGGQDSNTVNNGLLLRTDIHTLLDLRLLAFDPDTRQVLLSRLLAGTQYEVLSGTRLAEPSAEWQRPSQEALLRLWHDFREAETLPGLARQSGKREVMV